MAKSKRHLSPPPAASSQDALKRMKSQQQRDTRPEMLLRSALHKRGHRYRVDVAPLPDLRSRADIVFTRLRVAVFVDGCFWHSCPEHGTMPKKNTSWWRRKLAANVARDTETDDRLRKAGWEVIRVWEHTDSTQAASRIAKLLRKRRSVLNSTV